MYCLPTTREGMMGAIAHYLHRVCIMGEPKWNAPKKIPTWNTHRVDYSWIKAKEVSEKDAKKAARGNL